jgi:hypothetical protein
MEKWTIIKILLIVGATWNVYLLLTDNSSGSYGECGGSGYMRDCD